MLISSDSIVSNSEVIKNYKSCKDKAESCGKIFIVKNNQPDAILFSASEYKRFSALIELLETLDDEGISAVIKSLPIEGTRKVFSIDSLRKMES